MKKCSNCNFAILQDFGYSNWTVEGTEVYCSKNLNPNGQFDRWYGEDERDLFAEKCSQFADSEGPACVDCDREDIPYNSKQSDAPSWSEYATNYVSAETLRDILAG